MDAAGVDRAIAWGYSRGAGLAAAVAAEFPDRVAALILTGGGDLTPAAIADTAPSPVIDAMYRGDFGPLWDEYSFSAEDRRYDQEFNDPRALGAMAIAERRSNFAIDFDRVAAPALVYVGSSDQPDEERMTADALGVELQVLPARDHLEAFSRLDLVKPLVREFLETLEL